MSIEARDDLADVLGDKSLRRRIRRAIREIERDSLGLPEPDLARVKAAEESRLSRLRALSMSKVHPAAHFTNFLRGPRSLRGQGKGSLDAMFQIDPRDAAEGCTSFWLYGSHKLTQRTLGTVLPTALALGGIPYTTKSPDPSVSEGMPSESRRRPATVQDVSPKDPESTTFLTSVDLLAPSRTDAGRARSPSPVPRRGELDPNVAREIVRQAFLVSPLCASLKKQIDGLMGPAASRRRCGVLFDLISTANIIRSGVPHLIGEFVYEYLAAQHSDKLAVKFVFVGITDNANCCAARDVLCRDEFVNGVYVGGTKRNDLDALDNVHVFAVFPQPGRAAGFSVPSMLGGSPGLSAIRSTIAAQAASLANPAAIAALTASSGGYVLNRLRPLTDDELRRLQEQIDPDDDTSFVSDLSRIGKVRPASSCDESRAVTEHKPKIDPLTKRRVFDRRDWVAVRAVPLATPPPPRRPASVNGSTRGPSSSLEGRSSSPRARMMGVDLIGFPPALAAALRSASGMVK